MVKPSLDRHLHVLEMAMNAGKQFSHMRAAHVLQIPLCVLVLKLVYNYPVRAGHWCKVQHLSAGHLVAAEERAPTQEH